MPDHLDLVNAYVRRMRAWTADALKKGERDVWGSNALTAPVSTLDRTLT
jgi:hypothetical protein